MKSTSLFTAIILSVATLMLSGCYDNGDDYCDFYNCNADPSGIYEGYATDQTSNATTPVVAIIDDPGDGTLSRQDGSYYRLSVGTSGNSLNGSYLGNGNNSGSLSGSVTQGGLDLYLNGSGNHVVAVSLNYDTVYGLHASLPTLQGNWSTATSSYNGIGCASGSTNCPPAGSIALSLSIQSAGQFNGTDSSGCTYDDGYFSLVDPQYNAYYERFTKTCGSGPTVRFDGLATYFPASGSGNNTVPAQILLMADDSNGHYISQLLQ